MVYPLALPPYSEIWERQRGIFGRFSKQFFAFPPLLLSFKSIEDPETGILQWGDTPICLAICASVGMGLGMGWDFNLIAIYVTGLGCTLELSFWNWREIYLNSVKINFECRWGIPTFLKVLVCHSSQLRMYHENTSRKRDSPHSRICFFSSSCFRNAESANLFAIINKQKTFPNWERPESVNF